MGKVTPISEVINVSESFRRLADEIDAGEFAGECATVILDGCHVISIGKNRVDRGASAQEAIYDMTIGIHRLAYPVCKYIDEHGA